LKDLHLDWEYIEQLHSESENDSVHKCKPQIMGLLYISRYKYSTNASRLNSKIVSNYRIVIPTLDGPYNIAKVPVPAEENLTHGIYDSSHNYLLQLTTTWRGSRNFTN
jgi:hypothetical protein